MAFVILNTVVILFCFATEVILQETCPANQTYTGVEYCFCTSMCPGLQCSTLDVCISFVETGCECIEGYYRLSPENDACVHGDDCPAIPSPVDIGNAIEPELVQEIPMAQEVNSWYHEAQEPVQEVVGPIVDANNLSNVQNIEGITPDCPDTYTPASYCYCESLCPGVECSVGDFCVRSWCECTDGYYRQDSTRNVCVPEADCPAIPNQDTVGEALVPGINDKIPLNQEIAEVIIEAQTPVQNVVGPIVYTLHPNIIG